MEKIKALKQYFEKEPSVILAFVFGSQAKGKVRRVSDWDIAVYFKPKEYLELETEEDYPGENKIWPDLVDILKTDDVDFVTLNRARPSLVFSILNSGIPLAIKDRKIYLELLSKTHYEAVDFWNFVYDFWKIREGARSFLPETKALIIEKLVFLENEFKDIGRFKRLSWEEYQKNRNERRNIERWIENLAMASLDIAKTILAAEKKEVPQSYKDTLRMFGMIYFNEVFGRQFSEFAEFRNIVVHEYLDIKWRRIKNFITKAEKLYPKFIKKVKKLVK